jgi:tRNA modification GTPase
MLTNVRHYEALGHVDQALLHVAKGLTTGLPADLVVIDLRDALHHLGTITGQVTTDEVLGTIFSRFCIGK